MQVWGPPSTTNTAGLNNGYQCPSPPRWNFCLNGMLLIVLKANYQNSEFGGNGIHYVYIYT